jgi:hypothetical protein
METWTSRELPILRALVARLDDPDVRNASPEQLAAVTGLSPDAISRALTALAEAEPPYFTGAKSWGERYPNPIFRVTERGRRAAGQWPASDSAADAIIAALESAAEIEPDGDKKSALGRTAAFLAGAGREVFYRVVTGVVSGEVSQHIPPHI